MIPVSATPAHPTLPASSESSLNHDADQKINTCRSELIKRLDLTSYEVLDQNSEQLNMCFYDLEIPQHAIDYYKSFLKFHEQFYVEPSLNYARALCRLGHAYFVIGEQLLSIHYYEEYLKANTRLNSSYGPEHARALIELGHLYTHSKKEEQAISSYEDFLNNFHSKKVNISKLELAKIYRNLGRNYAIQDDYQKSISLLQKSLDLFKELEEEAPPLEIARVCDFLGHVQNKLGQIDDAIQSTDQALSFFQQNGQFTSKWPGCLLFRASLFQKKNEWPKIEESYLQAFEVYRQFYTKTPHFKFITILNLLGDFYMDQGKCKDAIQTYACSLSYCDQLGAKAAYEKKKTLNCMGLAFLADGATDSAVSCFQESLQIQLPFSSFFDYYPAMTLCYLGDAYMKLGETEKALKSYEQSVAIYKSSCLHSFNYANTVNKLANVHKFLGNHILAIEWYERSLIIYRQMEESPYYFKIAFIYYHLAEAYQVLGNKLDLEPNIYNYDLNKAIEYYHKSLWFFNRAHEVDWIQSKPQDDSQAILPIISKKLKHLRTTVKPIYPWLL